MIRSTAPAVAFSCVLAGPNVWLQVTGPEQSAAQIEAAMRALLDGLQHP